MLLAVLLLLGLAAGPARAAEDVEGLLLEAARSDLPLSKRLAAAGAALASHTALEPTLAVRAGSALLAGAPEPACWLILRGLDAGFVARDVRVAGRAAVAEAWVRAGEDGAARTRLAAVGLLLGARDADRLAALTSTWPPPDFVHAVLRREIAGLKAPAGLPVLDAGGEAVAAALTQSLETARLLDEATEDEPGRMRKGLDGLLTQGAAALPLLLHEAHLGAEGAPVGRMPRAARAILALGLLKQHAATPVLATCLRSTDGWVRVAAATALGDLGDPAGAVPLAVHLATLGDIFRARDQWDYPGASETNIPEKAWASIDYFCVDDAAADALLRLGVPGAAGYLIHEKLDPSRSNWRIRVFQDAVDALRRSVPTLRIDDPENGYNVDAGLPQRDAAFTRLALAWYGLRDRTDLLATTLDETDAGFRKAARALAERLRGTDIRTFMITKPACAMLGRAMTPTLIETLAHATRGSARAELAETLGLVRDPRAIPVLLGLLHDERSFVRARAAEALGVQAGASKPALDALIATLSDRKQGPRVSALKGLVAAPARADILAAYKAHKPPRLSEDGRMAETAFLLVQEGAAHWPPIEAGLQSKQRYIREAWWHLVRTALDWPAFLHDAKARPDARRVRRVTRAQVLARLDERRRGGTAKGEDR